MNGYGIGPFRTGLLIELEGLGKPNLKIGPMMVLHVSCEWGSSMAGFLGKVTVVHQTFFFFGVTLLAPMRQQCAKHCLSLITSQYSY